MFYLTFLCVFINALLGFDIPQEINVGNVVRYKNEPSQVGVVMYKYENKLIIWWDDSEKYIPFKSNFIANFYGLNELIIASDDALTTPIYREPYNSISESMVIGKHVCYSLSNCRTCYNIIAYWKQHWVLTDPSHSTTLTLNNFSKFPHYGCEKEFRYDDPCFVEFNGDDPRRCVIIECCKIAFEEATPTYCHC